jgi:myo-inositol-1(or 4)-monophosphatase
MKPTLDFIKEIARHAGEILDSFVGEDLDVKHKSRTDLVTKADHASEQYLIETIRKSFPDHAINAEESGKWEGAAEHQWFIDPLDGTLNFAHGVPIYAVSIGYAYQGRVELGVVYDPTRKEFFSAERGKGATLNDNPMHVSGFEDLVDCMLVTGFPNDMWGTPDDNTRNFIRFSKLAQTVRRLGSAALDVVYVAAGRLDGFWEVEIFNWDVAAGGLIVREAGGVVTNLYGNEDFLKEPISIVCANPTIHAKMLEVLKEEREERDQN